MEGLKRGLGTMERQKRRIEGKKAGRETASERKTGRRGKNGW